MRRLAYLAGALAVLIVQRSEVAVAQKRESAPRERAAELRARLEQLHQRLRSVWPQMRLYGGGGMFWWGPAPGETPRGPLGLRRRFLAVPREVLWPPRSGYWAPWSRRVWKELGLTGEQREKIADILAKKARERFLILSNPELKGRDTFTRLRDLRGDTRQQIENVLTPEQKQKLRAWRERPAAEPPAKSKVSKPARKPA